MLRTPPLASLVSSALVAVLACAFAAAPLPAQDLFKQAPPEVEKALRQRLDEFYTLMKEGRFRAADAYIAEDSKDSFYEQEKKKIKGHEIIRINWDDNFQRAEVVVAVETEFQIRGMTIPAKAPTQARWKIENNNWFHYFDSSKAKKTPFGTMAPGPNNTKGMDPEEMLRDPRIIFNQIKIEKEEARLKSYEASTDSIKVINGLQGGIRVSFLPDMTIPGFSYKVENEEIGAGGEATVVFSIAPKDRTAKPTITGRIRVEPFERAYPIRVVFIPAPESLGSNATNGNPASPNSAAPNATSPSSAASAMPAVSPAGSPSAGPAAAVANPPAAAPSATAATSAVPAATGQLGAPPAKKPAKPAKKKK